MDFSPLFSPRSVAIVGVSRDPRKVGYLIAQNMIKQGYDGEMYFINHKAKEHILHRPVYQTIADIPHASDVVVLAIPAPFCLEALEEAYVKGIRCAVIVSGGFREIGAEGAGYEASIQQFSAKTGMRILGPNCIGYVNTKRSVNATFLRDSVPAGNVGLISQSGALTSYAVDDVIHKRYGFSQIITLGNKTVLNESDALTWLAQDDETHVIGMYLEDVVDGKRFLQSLRRASLEKPVIVLKSGKTEAGAHAAASHTGSMAGSYDVFAAAVTQSGGIITENLSHFMSLLQVCAYPKLPLSNTLAVVSNAGGLGVLITDAAIQNKLSMMSFSKTTATKLTAAINKPLFAPHNPLDLLGDATAKDLENALRILMNDKKIGACICMLTPQANTEIDTSAEVLIKIHNHVPFPIYPVFLGDASMTHTDALFTKHHLQRWKHMDGLIASIAAYRNYRDTQAYVGKEKDTALSAITDKLARYAVPKQHAVKKKTPVVSYALHDALDLLKDYQIPVVESILVRTQAQLHQVAHTVYPAVAKIIGDHINHKTDVHGVITHIHDAKELEGSFRQLHTIIGFTGMVVQPMREGFEIIIGAKRDRTFGPVIILGIGGIYTEVIRDVARCIFPISFPLFEKAVMATKLSAFVKGVRGKKGVDIHMVYTISENVHRLMEEHAEIQEVDINPLIVQGSTIAAVDARMMCG